MLPEQDFKRYLREYLENELPDDTRQLLEQLEMELASPGDWEAAKHHPLEESGKAEISD